MMKRYPYFLARNTTKRARWALSGMVALLLGIVFLLVAPGTALAHAEYVSSDPGTNAQLAKAPTIVTVHFSENVDPAGSDITIYDVDGKLVSTAAAQVDRADLKTMTVSMKSNGSEIYVVNWHTVSAVEGHHDSGSFRFFVNISPMLKGMVSGGGMGSMGGSMSSSSTTSSSSSGIPLWGAILIGIGGLIIGGLAVWLFARSTLQGKQIAPETKTRT